MASDDQRRSSAAQFFMDEEDDKPAKEKITKLINDATVSADSETKNEKLLKAFDFAVKNSPPLTHWFFQDFLGFQNDRSADIRKTVIFIIEEVLKETVDMTPEVITNIQVLLQDKAPQVQKRCIQCVTTLYKLVLMWLARAPTVTEKMQKVWNLLNNMKAYIINMVDSDNDGLRTQIVKFLETIVLLQSYPDPDLPKRENDFSLEDIPLTLKDARRRKLEEEGLTVFDLMIKFHGSPHISSANLMACMGALTTISKLRPTFMDRVVVALEALHTNLPPTLTTSQVNSVRKSMKMQLLNILKHPASIDFHTNITTLLSDLGASSSEINRALPKTDEYKKRARKATAPSEVPAKKTRLDEPPPPVITQSAVDITESFIIQRLSPELAAQLVMSGMSRLPDSMPSLFSSTYTPIAAAGTQGQIKHVARLLATQLNAVGLGPGASIAKTQGKITTRTAMDEDEEGEDENVAPTSSGTILDDPGFDDDIVKGLVSTKSIKLEVSKPLSSDMREDLQTQAVLRILKAQDSAITGGVNVIRAKLIASMAASFGMRVRQTIMKYVLNDIKNQLNLVLSWMYEEYSFMQGFTKRPPTQADDHKYYNTQYDHLICSVINTVISNKDMKEREMVLMRICTEMPLITEEAVALMTRFSSMEVLGLNIINKVILMRPPKEILFLKVLLENSSHQTHEIRETAISHIMDLYMKEEMRPIIEDHAVTNLRYLKEQMPPQNLFGVDKGRPQRMAVWSADSANAGLFLYMSLLPVNQSLIHELSNVYVVAVADVKRIILRAVEHPVKAMGMDSPELLKFVEDCPKGSETLVTRLIHILTDKAPPSVELVERVRELYQTRVSDVRFLIPVLNGLTKNEVIAALPKLIKLNPIVVKEVFNRLLCSSVDPDTHKSPISPSELLIALHMIDPTDCEWKIVIKATSLCFNDKKSYTQEVLAVVMQQLMEVNPLPTLLMRTVIQSLSLYPPLIGFVMNILQRLILKQVWRQKKVWEGFIKCCHRAQPHSYQVLLQLPPQQLEDVFINAPDMKQPLLDHILEFTENQRAHIPQDIMDILLGPQNQHPTITIKDEPMSPPRRSILPPEKIKEEPIDLDGGYAEPAPPGMD